MSAAVRSRQSHPVTHLLGALVIAPALVGLVACTSSPPPAPTSKPTAAKPTSAASSAPKVAASPGASPQASPSPSAGAITILDATLADATPWVSLRLSAGEPTIVSGWRLEVGAQSVVIPGNAIIQPGETLILRAGEGRSSEREIYLGAESHAVALAAAPGARVRLIKATGEVAAETTVPRY